MNNTPPILPDDAHRLAEIDALIAEDVPSSSPVANLLRRCRPRPSATHVDQLKKELFSMNRQDFAYKRKKRPLRFSRLWKAAAALLVLAGLYMAYLATRPVSYHSYVVYSEPPVDLQMYYLLATQQAEVAWAVIIEPTPAAPPIQPPALTAPMIPRAVSVPVKNLQTLDGQPIVLRHGQRVGLYMQLYKVQWHETAGETVLLKLTDQAFVHMIYDQQNTVSLFVSHDVAGIVEQLVSPDLLPQSALYIDLNPLP
jgi:hypothetical protein